MIDHIATTNKSNIVVSDVKEISLSDHFLVYCVRKFRGASKKQHKIISTRPMKNFSEEDFLKDLSKVDWKKIVTSCSCIECKPVRSAPFIVFAWYSQVNNCKENDSKEKDEATIKCTPYSDFLSLRAKVEVLVKAYEGSQAAKGTSEAELKQEILLLKKENESLRNELRRKDLLIRSLD